MRRAAALLAIASVAGDAPAAGASREDALLALRRLAGVLHGSAPAAKGAARDRLDEAVAAMLARDPARAVEASLQARAALLGREASLADRLAWGLRLALAPRLFERGAAAETDVTLSMVTVWPEGAPDFVGVSLRLDPHDAEPVDLVRTTCRRESLAGAGDRIRVRLPETTSSCAALRAIVRVGARESESAGVEIGSVEGVAARLGALRAALAARLDPARRDGETASLLVEAKRLEAVLTGRPGSEGVDPLDLLQRCERLARTEGGTETMAGFSRRGRFLPSGALAEYALFVPQRPPPPALLPLVLVVPGSFEDEASPFEEWTAGGLPAAAAARGVAVAVVPLSTPREEPDPFGALLGEIARAAPIDRGRVHLVGRGAGATLALREAVATPTRYASLALLDGGVARAEDFAALGAIPILVGGAGRGPTATSLRSLERLAADRENVRVRIVPDEGYLEVGPKVIGEVVERAAAPSPRER